MQQKEFLFTSESVSEGHPDKVADRISDGVLDALLAQDKHSRVACETLVKNGVVVLAGEITSKAKINYDSIVRQAVREIGYSDPAIGFDSETCEIIHFMSEQSPDISVGVDESSDKAQGAGDQGFMFGFACDETPELMPLPISLAHKLVKKLAELRKSGNAPFLRPDAKSQVTVKYNGLTPVSVDAVVVSTQHTEDYSLTQLSEYVIENVVKAVIPQNYLKATKYLINPTGRFVIGGPVGDCGLTGRKIIVDTYGGYSRHGGGAFSGKDPSKVDRSAAYAARHIAKNVVGSGLAKRCEVQVAYAIGVAEPVSVYVDTFQTGTVPDAQIAKGISSVFNLTPRGIIDALNLLAPIYAPTASYGHFGREAPAEGYFTWEKLDKAEALKKAVG